MSTLNYEELNLLIKCNVELMYLVMKKEELHRHDTLYPINECAERIVAYYKEYIKGLES